MAITVHILASLEVLLLYTVAMVKAMVKAMAEAVLIALMAHKVVIIERKLAQCRMARTATRMTIIERTTAVEQ